MNRRDCLTVLAGLTTCSILSSKASLSQSVAYPNQPIKVIVPFPAGGAADSTIRLLEPKLRDLLGQPLVIENRSGANGIIGATQVARATPDGHTILFAPREVLGVNPVLHASVTYDAVRDFAPIGVATEGPYVLIMSPSAGVRTFADFVALAKRRELAYASFGHGSMGHLNMEALARHVGVKLLHVPYRGAPAAVQAVVTGDVAVAIATPPAVLGFIAEGKLTALVIGAKTRSELVPNVPTLTEVGQPETLLIPAAFAMAAPQGTPAPAIARLNGALRQALADPIVGDRLKTIGLVPVGGAPDAMAQAVQDDLIRFGALIKATGIKAEQ